jgi:hypothetical protein
LNFHSYFAESDHDNFFTVLKSVRRALTKSINNELRPSIKQNSAKELQKIMQDDSKEEESDEETDDGETYVGEEQSGRNSKISKRLMKINEIQLRQEKRKRDNDEVLKSLNLVPNKMSKEDLLHYFQNGYNSSSFGTRLISITFLSMLMNDSKQFGTVEKFINFAVRNIMEDQIKSKDLKADLEKLVNTAELRLIWKNDIQPSFLKTIMKISYPSIDEDKLMDSVLNELQTQFPLIDKNLLQRYARLIQKFRNWDQNTKVTIREILKMFVKMKKSDLSLTKTIKIPNDDMRYIIQGIVGTPENLISWNYQKQIVEYILMNFN